MCLGITNDLSTVGKIVIMILMFIGRVGLISFLYSLGGKSKKLPYHYPKERVIIGIKRMEVAIIELPPFLSYSLICYAKYGV